MSYSKSTYLIYGISLPVKREKDGQGSYHAWLGDTGRELWDDDLLPYIEGHDGVVCSLLDGEEPIGKAYFGLVLASTHERYLTNETDVTGWFVTNQENGRVALALGEMAWLLGRQPEPRLLMVDIIS